MEVAMTDISADLQLIADHASGIVAVARNRMMEAGSARESRPLRDISIAAAQIQSLATQLKKQCGEPTPSNE
jgi:hypothetical protein